jgi:hypothetical protein
LVVEAVVLKFRVRGLLVVRVAAEVTLTAVALEQQVRVILGALALQLALAITQMAAAAARVLRGLLDMVPIPRITAGMAEQGLHPL